MKTTLDFGPLVSVHLDTVTESLARVCEAMVVASIVDLQLAGERIPPLYRSGVRYRRELEGTESLTVPSVVYSRGFGDCGHLAVWLCAERRLQGLDSTVVVRGKLLPNGRLYHAQVLTRGKIEDPSAVLGMNTHG